MHRNASLLSRLAFALAALALTAMTLGLALILPAKTDSDGREAARLAAAPAGAAAGVITLAPLEVVAVRTPDENPVARGDALAQAAATRTAAPSPAKRLCLTIAGKRVHRHATEAS